MATRGARSTHCDRVLAMHGGSAGSSGGRRGPSRRRASPTPCRSPSARLPPHGGGVRRRVAAAPPHREEDRAGLIRTTPMSVGSLEEIINESHAIVSCPTSSRVLRRHPLLRRQGQAEARVLHPHAQQGKIGSFIASIPDVMVAALLCFMRAMLCALGLSNLCYGATGSSRNAMAGMALEGSQFDAKNYDSKMQELLSQGETLEFFTSYDEVHESFDDMDLQENLLGGIYAYCFKKPLAIQQRGIVPFCKGLDVIQQGRTGKTDAGILQQLDYGLAECHTMIHDHENEMLRGLRPKSIHQCFL